MQQIVKEKEVILIKLKVEIARKDLARFVSVLSPHVNSGDTYLHIYKEDGVYSMNIFMNYTEEAMKCISFLHYLGDIQEFFADQYDLHSEYGDQRIILENGIFYLFEAELEDAYAEYENDQGHYDTFRRLILFNEGITEKDYFSSRVPEITRDLFYQAIEKATTLDELKTQLVMACGKEIEFRDELFEIQISFSRKENLLDEELKMFLYVSSEVDDMLVMNYDAMIKEFKRTEFYPMDLSGSVNWEAEIQTLSDLPATVEVQWDMLRDGKYSVLTLDEEYAKKLFLEEAVERVKISVKEEWVLPCTVCVNRLEKIVDGCKKCHFQLPE